MTMPDVVPPYSSASTPPSGTNIHGTSYTYVLNGGNYIISKLTGLTLYVSNSSVLYVTGDATASQIVYAPGTKLDLYVGGKMVPHPDLRNELANADGSFTLSWAVAPEQFRILGLNSCTTMNMSGGNFVGVIYAPHVDFNSSGNGSLYGAATVNSFSCNGTFNFHYDT